MAAPPPPAPPRPSEGSFVGRLPPQPFPGRLPPPLSGMMSPTGGRPPPFPGSPPGSPPSASPTPPPPPSFGGPAPAPPPLSGPVPMPPPGAPSPQASQPFASQPFAQPHAPAGKAPVHQRGASGGSSSLALPPGGQPSAIPFPSPRASHSRAGSAQDEAKSPISGGEDDADEWTKQLGGYRHRVTIFEKKEFRDADHCKHDGCVSRKEMGGFCMKHYYESSRVQQAPAAGAAAAGVGEQQKLLEEFIVSEKLYGKGLKSIVRGFVNQMEKLGELGRPVLSRVEISKIFLNIKDILEIHRKFYADLKKLRLDRTLLSPEFGRVLTTYSPFFKMYAHYVSNYGESEKVILAIRQKREPFDFFITLMEKCEGKPILELMLMPVQRIPRFLVLLKGLDAAFAQHAMHASIRKALEQVENVADEINKSFTHREARLRVVEVQKHLESGEMIVTPTRYHVMDGLLRKKYSSSGVRFSDYQNCWFFLFDDMLMYTTIPKSNGNCKVRQMLPLLDMTIEAVPDTGKKSIHGFRIQSPVKSFTLSAPTEQDKEKWMTELNKLIAVSQQKKATLKPAAIQNIFVQPDPEPVWHPTAEVSSPVPYSGDSPPPFAGFSLVASPAPAPPAGGPRPPAGGPAGGPRPPAGPAPPAMPPSGAPPPLLGARTSMAPVQPAQPSYLVRFADQVEEEGRLLQY